MSRSEDDAPRTEDDVTGGDEPGLGEPATVEPTTVDPAPVEPPPAAKRPAAKKVTAKRASKATDAPPRKAASDKGAARKAAPRPTTARTTAARTTSRSAGTARTAPATAAPPTLQARARVDEPPEIDDDDLVVLPGNDLDGLGLEDNADGTTTMDLDPAPIAAEPADDGAPPAGDAGHRRGVFIPLWAAIVAVVVAGLLVAGLVLTSLQVSHDNAVSSSRTSALAAARTYSAELASYNYQTLSSDFGLVEQHSTPAFRKSFVQSSASLSKVLVQYHATAKATVAAAGLTSLSGNTAVALVFVNQTVSNTEQKSGPTTDASRVQIQLVRTNGTWLIDHVNLL